VALSRARKTIDSNEMGSVGWEMGSPGELCLLFKVRHFRPTVGFVMEINLLERRWAYGRISGIFILVARLQTSCWPLRKDETPYKQLWASFMVFGLTNVMSIMRVTPIQSG
jgi:hypothetical protein